MLWKSPEVDPKLSEASQQNSWTTSNCVRIVARAFNRERHLSDWFFVCSFFQRVQQFGLRMHVDANAGADGLRLCPTAFAGWRAADDREKKVGLGALGDLRRVSTAIPRSSGTVEIENSVCPEPRHTCARLRAATQASRGIKQTRMEKRSRFAYLIAAASRYSDTTNRITRVFQRLRQKCAFNWRCSRLYIAA